LHGFCSGPQSHKAQALHARMAERGIADHYVCPQLPPSPASAIALAESIIGSSRTPVTLIGSSLGGYYATWLAEKYALKAVLVNPAVPEHLDASRFLGPQVNLYSGEPFEFTAADVDQLRAIRVDALRDPTRYWLLAETDDEVLDYRHAVDKYRGAQHTVLPGGDHSFTQWENYLDQVLAFAAVAAR
jgi:uncharacterized protein